MQYRRKFPEALGEGVKYEFARASIEKYSKWIR